MNDKFEASTTPFRSMRNKRKPADNFCYERCTTIGSQFDPELIENKRNQHSPHSTEQMGKTLR